MCNCKCVNDDKELSKYREFIFYGGRGGGKTYDLTQFFLYKAITEKCRILCWREFSNTNKSSLVSEFKNAIYQNDLEAEIKELIFLTLFLLVNP